MDIQKTYHLPFPVEKVYAAWTSSDTVIPPATAMHVEPSVGGAYQLFMEGSDSPANEGRFLVVEPTRHLRYTWEWFKDGKVTEIDVAFTAEDQGTRLDLAHTGFTDTESHAMHDSGWDSYIDGLTRLLSGQT